MLFRTLIGILLTLTSLWAHAETSVLTIATSEYPPFEYTDNGELKGGDVDTVREAVERMGLEPRFVVLPWARAENRVRRGDTDMLFSLTHSSERERYYHFTAPISLAQDVFFARADAGIRWSELDDLSHLRVGLTASYSYAESFMNWIGEPDRRVVEINQEAPELVGLRMLALQRIDVFICEHSVCNYLLDKHRETYPELETVTSIPGIVGQIRPFRAAVSRQHPDGEALRDRFNQALADIRAEGSD